MFSLIIHTAFHRLLQQLLLFVVRPFAGGDIDDDSDKTIVDLISVVAPDSEPIAMGALAVVHDDFDGEETCSIIETAMTLDEAFLKAVSEGADSLASNVDVVCGHGEVGAGLCVFRQTRQILRNEC